jgi:hypothetical protein
MTVSIQGEGYRGVPEEFLDVLGMDIAREQQRSAGVSEIVEPESLGQTSAL